MFASPPQTGENGSAPIRPPGLIPKIAVKELINLPGEIDVVRPEAINGNVSLLELIIICKIAKQMNPRVAFEIGTFDGRTTVNIAANTAPESRTYTLDLPRTDIANTTFALEKHDKLYIDKEASGVAFAESELKSKITQLYGDSAKFDFSLYDNKAQLIFIDGSHAYEYVLNDSHNALQMLGDNQGAILWHDYDTEAWFGVTQALNELYQNDKRYRGMRHVEETALAILWNGNNLTNV